MSNKMLILTSNNNSGVGEYDAHNILPIANNIYPFIQLILWSTCYIFIEDDT